MLVRFKRHTKIEYQKDLTKIKLDIDLFSFFFTERNLNPKAACLKRREEEKAEDGPKLGPGPHHMLAGPHYPTLPVSEKSHYF